MANNNFLQLYGEFCKFIKDAESNSFYSFFQNTLQTSQPTISIFEKYADRKIDLAWLEAIENAIIPLDFIIRNPTSFIKREEDIIPIGQAREIGPESVKHLSQHTNLIESVKNGEVLPNKILSVTKEDSIDTYENRFVNTLLKLTSYFLDKRMSVLMKDNKYSDIFDYHLEGNARVGSDNLSYHFNMHLESPHVEAEGENLINADISTMTHMQRVERLRKIFYNFNSSSFARSLYDAPAVHAPLVMTNKLLKNPYFIKAVELWNFLNAYNQVGFTTEYVEQYRTPVGTEKTELFTLVMLQYVMMKKQGQNIATSALNNEEELPQPSTEGETQVEVAAPRVVSRAIDQLCDTFDLTIDEVRRVYEKAISKKEKKKTAEFSKAKGIFERAILFEKEASKQAEIERRERIAAELKRRMEVAEQDAKRLEEERRSKLDIHEEPFIWKYRYSFRARLIQAQNPLQDYYSALKNHILSYEGLKASMYWGYERFSLNKEPLVKINGRNKTLNVMLAVSPERYTKSLYKVLDLRKNGKDTQYPAKFRIHSDRTLKYALDIIDDFMKSRNIKKLDVAPIDYHEQYRSTESLLRTKPALVTRNKKYVNPNKEKFDFSDYRFSFHARLIQAQNPLQDYYTGLKNHLLSFNGVKDTMSWSYERFSLGKKSLVKVSGRTKILNVLIAISPEKYLGDENNYVDDMRSEHKQVQFPTKIRIRSERSLKYALDVITDLMSSLNVEKSDTPFVDYHEKYRPVESLLKMKPALVIKNKKPKEENTDKFGFDWKYRFSFRARLIQAQNPLQDFYTELKNRLLCYKGVKGTMSWSYERFSLGRKSIARINGRNNTLNIMLSANPEKYLDANVKVEDLREKGREVQYPTRIRVRSDRALKYALEIIDDYMSSIKAEKRETEFVDYHEKFRSTESMTRANPPLVIKNRKGKKSSAEQNETDNSSDEE